MKKRQNKATAATQSRALLSQKAKDALEQGDEAYLNGNFREAHQQYLTASRAGSREGQKKLQLVQKRLNMEALTNKDLQDSERQRQLSNKPTEKPKIAPSMAIPKEDKSVMVHDYHYSSGRSPKKVVATSGRNEHLTRSITVTGKGDLVTHHKLESLLKSAQLGDLDKQYQLARYYEEQGNKEEANKWLKIAIQKGHPDALYYYSIKYLNLAKTYLEKAAKKKHSAAQQELKKLKKYEKWCSTEKAHTSIYYVIEDDHTNYDDNVKCVKDSASLEVYAVDIYTWIAQNAQKQDTVNEDKTTSVLFNLWVDGIGELEKTHGLILRSGSILPTVQEDLPSYQYLETNEDEEQSVHHSVTPWYVRMWALIKSIFVRK